MNDIGFLEKFYKKALDIDKYDYKLKVSELMDICNGLARDSKLLQTSSLKKYIVEVQKISVLITNIHLSDKNQVEKESLLEQCRLMIEVYLGQALILEIECNE